MDTHVYRWADRPRGELWPAGPWDQEPDKVQWPDPDTGLPCLAVRGPVGAWCGYVGVPPGHPYHGVDYHQVPADVHGGLTFSDKCAAEGDDPAHGICHIPGPGEPHDVWWLGFDCAHWHDIAPAVIERMPFRHEQQTYRTLGYVKAECTSLARQLAQPAPQIEHTSENPHGI